MQKLSVFKKPSETVRYIMAANNIIISIIVYYLTGFNSETETEILGTLISLFYLSFLAISVLSLGAGTTGIIGEDFWLTIIFQLILSLGCIWLAYSFFIEDHQLIVQNFDMFNLETIGYLYTIPGSIMGFWTIFVFLKMKYGFES